MTLVGKGRMPECLVPVYTSQIVQRKLMLSASTCIDLTDNTTEVICTFNTSQYVSPVGLCDYFSGKLCNAKYIHFSESTPAHSAFLCSFLMS